MAIYLHEKFAPKIAEAFRRESFIDGRLGNGYSFSGVKTVKLTTPLTVPLNDYQRSGVNRYGTPKEMQDIVQELTMSQDKSFSLTVDKGNQADQNGIKAAARMLALEVREQVVPEKDRYTFGRLAAMAGMIVGSAAALTKTNICERISEGTRVLDDGEVPADGRTLFVNAGVYKLLRLSEEFIKCESLASRSLKKGEVGEYDNMPVVKVPSSRFPAGLNFLIVHKSAATAPSKISDTKLHTDPPGLSGNLMEGRFYYDCFVIGARANGIYAEVNTGAGGSAVLAAPTVTGDAGGSISVASGTTVNYTTDGSDPRYSQSASLITANKTGGFGETGQLLRAYALKEGAFASPVSEAVLA